MGKLGCDKSNEVILIGFVFKTDEMTTPDAFLRVYGSGTDSANMIVPGEILFHLTEEVDSDDPKGALHAIEKLALTAEIKLARLGAKFPHLVRQLHAMRPALG